ncbi:conserved hypothetical protein [Xenorhabdus nematophila F1]|nr:conserved hypothetical protein [Xenorhabdus nematophila F1]CEE90941.1 hypothetical protein XNA1_1840004 [Xenorhabdus nematophila str. Anatoliense]CEE91106.1 hypothetical protein XNA1_1970004 [Xenorhabdus nematophila str. Anatoliense]CEF29112.1 hypothetical protein XNW1_1570004 [Xenorhabdus nematophila str. Websteri]CEF29590.1 hypothetical protein XNW1_1910004 [Xenorhabdus nematophila str. Websteri]
MKNNLRLKIYSIKSPAYAGDFFAHRKDDETDLEIVKDIFQEVNKNSC